MERLLASHGDNLECVRTIDRPNPRTRNSKKPSDEERTKPTFFGTVESGRRHQRRSLSIRARVSLERKKNGAPQEVPHTVSDDDIWTHYTEIIWTQSPMMIFGARAAFIESPLRLSTLSKERGKKKKVQNSRDTRRVTLCLVPELRFATYERHPFETRPIPV